MSDIKNLDDTKPKGSPLDSAINKLRETEAREIQRKIDETVKKAYDARRIYHTLLHDLSELLKEKEVTNSEFGDLLKELK